MVGYTVIADGQTLGRVDELVELTPGSWYFQVDGRLIPAVDEFITDINSESLTLTMALPAGLLEL